VKSLISRRKPQLQADFQGFAQFSLQALSIPAKNAKLPRIFSATKSRVVF
jgi:hypothetical protein